MESASNKQSESKCKLCFMHDYNNLLYNSHIIRSAWIKVLKAYIAVAENNLDPIQSLQTMANSLTYDIAVGRIKFPNFNIPSSDDDLLTSMRKFNENISDDTLSHYKQRRHSI